MGIKLLDKLGMLRAKKRCSQCNRRLWRWEKAAACGRCTSGSVLNTRLIKLSR